MARRVPHDRRTESRRLGRTLYREDLAVLCDFQSKRIDALIHNAMFFEEEIWGIIEAARRAFPLRHTDNGAGLRQLIHATRQTKERCEARALAAQLKRTQESMQEIEGFHAEGEPHPPQD